MANTTEARRKIQSSMLSLMAAIQALDDYEDEGSVDVSQLCRCIEHLDDAVHRVADARLAVATEKRERLIV